MTKVFEKSGSNRFALAVLLSAATWTATSATARAQTLFFETPKRDACVADGVREYSAIITGTNFSGNWVDACTTTTAVIEGAPRSSRGCATQADGRVWGKFSVPDSSCAQKLTFMTPKKDACLKEGMREWSAIITGENFFGDWLDACRTTTALIDGAERPSRGCAWQADSRVWGKFDVPDATCPKVLTVANGGCSIGGPLDAAPLGPVGLGALVLALRQRRRRG